MPARNERFHTPIARGRDGRSYCWMIIPAYEFAFDGSATLTQIHPNFAKAPKEKWAFDRLPLGLAHYDSVKLSLDLHLIEGTNLYTYLTDDGEAIERAYNLFANTIWVLLQGQGVHTQSTDINQLTAIYIGVQVHYVGQEVKGSRTYTDLKCEIELVPAGKVLLEALPIKQWAASVKLRTQLAGGMVNPLIPGVEKREICYDMAYTENGAVYAKAQRHSDGQEEALFMPYLRCFEELQRMLNATYRKLMRAPYTFSFHGSTEGSVGTPYDYKNIYQQSTTPTNALGAVIPREERLWLAYVRKKGTTEVIGGLMWENDGLAKQYSNALDFLQDATQEGGCKGYFHTSGTFAASIDLCLSWLRVWHGQNPVGNNGVAFIPLHKFGTAYSATRGANVVGGCQTSLGMQRGQNLKGYKYLVGGMSDNVRPYSVKCSLFTGPCINEGAVKNGQLQYYFVAAPSNRFTRVGGAHEFNGNLNLIVAQGGFTVNRWFYATTSFPGYNRSQSMICAAHHYSSYDLTPSGQGGLQGQYNDDLRLFNLPKWPGQFNTNESANYYHNIIVAAMFGAMAEMQKQNDLVTLGGVIGRLFSNRSQTILKVDVARTFATPGVAAGQYASRWLVQPSMFRAGLFPQLANDSVIIECESDFGTGRDSVTFFTRSTTT